MRECEEQRQYPRSAALAVFHGDLRAAVAVSFPVIVVVVVVVVVVVIVIVASFEMWDFVSCRCLDVGGG